MRIERVTATPGVSAFFFDDQAAIKAGAPRNGMAYEGEPVTPGYRAIREPGEALIVDLELSDGRVVRGDCAAVQYAGAGRRDPLFRAAELRPVVEGVVAEALTGRDAAAYVDNEACLQGLEADGDALHTAVEYGVSQALLAAAATARRTTMTAVLAEALGSEPATSPIPVFGQTGADRHRRAEKMLLKGVEVLPHGLFNSLDAIGENGQRLRAYLRWLADRAEALGRPDRDHRFHVDVYGHLGTLFDPPFDRPAVVEYLATLERAAAPHPLQIEGPIDAGDRAGQIAALGALRTALDDAGVDVDLVADEWCESRADVEAFVDAGAADLVQVKTPDVGSLLESGRAVRYCAGTDTAAYLGGTCNETTVSARASAHLALATDAAQVLAKPGMGFDEGYAVVSNEMRRTLAQQRRGERA